MNNMSNCTIMIPYYHDCDERYRNLKNVLQYLNEFFNTNVILGEQHTNQIETHFDELVKLTPNLSMRKITVPAITFPNVQEEIFYKTFVNNTMAKKANTKFISVWDCDSLFRASQITEAMNLLNLGICKVVYPFDSPTYDLPEDFHYLLEFYKFNVKEIEQFLLRQYTANKVMVGNGVFYDKEVFCAVGGYNLRFWSWGAEDNEIFHRCRNLGIPVGRVQGKVCHLDHPRGINSGDKNPFRVRNKELEIETSQMNKEDTMNLVKKLRKLNSMSAEELQKFVIENA